MNNKWSVLNEQIPEVFKMWGEIFVFQKKYYNAPKQYESTEDKNKFWNEFIAESEKIVRKYNSKLCSAVMVAITDDVSERSKADG